MKQSMLRSVCRTTLDSQVSVTGTSQTITIDDEDAATVEFVVTSDTTSENVSHAIEVRLNVAAGTTLGAASDGKHC